MAKFSGFPPGKIRFTRIPNPFFSELLPHITDLSELKVTLYTFWLLDQMEGDFRYFRLSNLIRDQDFLLGINSDSKLAKKNVRIGLNLAVERGTFLSTSVKLNNGEETFYFLNTSRGQAAIKALEQGAWQPSGDQRYPLTLKIEKPNIYRLYEDNIGPLTPMLSEKLQDTENEYPLDLVEAAIRKAVENNVRKWSYVEAILSNWKKEGRHDRTDQGDSEKDRQKYVEGKYADHIEH